jgi:hypothetical protein
MSTSRAAYGAGEKVGSRVPPVGRHFRLLSAVGNEIVVDRGSLLMEAGPLAFRLPPEQRASEKENSNVYVESAHHHRFHWQ